MNEVVKAAQALSDETRVRVLNLLMQRECCVCEVMDILEVSQVNASRYCNALRAVGFLCVRRDGRWKHYSVNEESCSPAIRDMLSAVRNSARTDPQARRDVRRLMSSERRCVVPSPTADLCEACDARLSRA